MITENIKLDIIAEIDEQDFNISNMNNNLSYNNDNIINEENLNYINDEKI